MHHTFGPIGQLGYAVHDVDLWIGNFLGAGVGPWWVYRNMRADVYDYLGARSTARFACGVSFSGPLMVEVIQPLDHEPSPYLDFLRAGREGLQHVCYFPDDFDAATAALLEQGCAQTVDGHTGGFAFRYFLRPGIDESIELGKLTPESRAGLEAQREVCAEWDGTDPVREI